MPDTAAGEVGGILPACLWQGDAFHLVSDLTPGRQALLTLARPISEGTWTAWSHDPGAVLLLLRQTNSEQLRADTLLSLLSQPELNQSARLLLSGDASRFVDYRSPKLTRLWQAQLRIAELAQRRAQETLGRVDPIQAWIAGLLAPLGWLVVASVAPDRVEACLEDSGHGQHPLETQGRRWGMDQDALARRVVRHWRLPDWFGRIVGHLRLPLDLAVDLGARRGLFEAVYQAACQAAGEGHDLGLVEKPQSTGAIRREEAHPVEPPTDPRQDALLPDLLLLAQENRCLRGRAVSARNLEEENDRLLSTLVHRVQEEQQRLQTGRLLALAELAAGAGHEINNPLAVISGRAQYLLARREALGKPEGLPSLVESLETIIAQTRRIHTLLRQLMLFARPPAPQRRTVDLLGLLRDVVGSLEETARPRSIRLEIEESGSSVPVLLDPEQVKTALTALVCNGIEAAPEGGWVRLIVRIPRPAHPVEVIVEDSGPGASPEQVPFLFDPFYSGRTAGRGKGMGLPVAWQLLRLQGGHLRYARSPEGPTRFVVVLPSGEEMNRSCSLSGGEAA